MLDSIAHSVSKKIMMELKSSYHLVTWWLLQFLVPCTLHVDGDAVVNKAAEQPVVCDTQNCVSYTRPDDANDQLCLCIAVLWFYCYFGA